MLPIAMLFCFPVQPFTELDNRLLSYGKKTIFNMAAVGHLEFF